MTSIEYAYQYAYKKFDGVTDIKSAMEIADNLKKMSPEDMSGDAGNTKYVPFYFWQDVMNEVHRILWHKFYQF